MGIFFIIILKSGFKFLFLLYKLNLVIFFFVDVKIYGKLSWFLFVLSLINRFRILFKILYGFVKGLLILFIIIIGLSLSCKVFFKINFVWGIGFL